jgi:hypothetical protein
MVLPPPVLPTTANTHNTLFPFQTAYASSESLPSPSFTSTQSVRLPDYSTDVRALLYSTPVGRITLKQSLDVELAKAGIPIMTRSSFRRAFPKSKKMLRHIFTLTSVYIFDHTGYMWSGVYEDIVKDDAILFNTCASQALAKILRHCIHDPSKVPGIPEFYTHICVWAVEKHLHLMVMFRRAARKWVQAIFRLKAGETIANVARFKYALAKGRLAQMPLVIIIVVQIFFLLSHEGLGWQLELLCRDLPEVVCSTLPSEFSVIPWSVRLPPSIVPRAMMIVHFHF